MCESATIQSVLQGEYGEPVVRTASIGGSGTWALDQDPELVWGHLGCRVPGGQLAPGVVHPLALGQDRGQMLLEDGRDRCPLAIIERQVLRHAPQVAVNLSLQNLLPLGVGTFRPPGGRLVAPGSRWLPLVRRR